MTAGAIYDLLNEDRRKALEIIGSSAPKRGIRKTRTATCRISIILVSPAKAGPYVL